MKDLIDSKIEEAEKNIHELFEGISSNINLEEAQNLIKFNVEIMNGVEGVLKAVKRRIRDQMQSNLVKTMGADDGIREKENID